MLKFVKMISPMELYWNNAISYETYFQDTENKVKQLEIATSKEDKDYYNYYHLGVTRMARLNKTYKPQEELLDLLKSKNFNGKILIIAEGWCGDASMTVPVVAHFFQGHNEVKITYRDQNDLIDQFLTNGGKSIPIVIILDENNNVINHWGPRPEYGNILLAKYKEDPENYTKEQFHNDLQVYYSKNKGQDIIKEILSLI